MPREVTSAEYNEIAFAIASVIFVHGERHPDGTVAYAHMAENDLDKPCDMLARLGIMIRSEGDRYHTFAQDWTPWTP
jgi:hypothetical protein